MIKGRRRSIRDDPPAPGYRVAVLVADPDNLDPGDAHCIARLRALGHDVTVSSGYDWVTADARRT